MSAHSSHSQPAAQAPALRRAVQILDLVSDAKTALTFTDIVSQLSLPKSSAHGLCGVLTELGLLMRTPSGTYRLGARSMRWANGFLRRTDVVSEFQQLLQEQPLLSAFTVTLTVLEGTQVVYLACANSHNALGFTFRIGMRLPAPFTATGKAILSTFTDSEINARFKNQWPKALTPNSVTDGIQFSEALAATRLRGFAIDMGEVREGMLCLGAPVKDASGLVCAGLAVSMLAAESNEEHIQNTGEVLIRMARILSSRLGYQAE